LVGLKKGVLGKGKTKKVGTSRARAEENAYSKIEATRLEERDGKTTKRVKMGLTSKNKYQDLNISWAAMHVPV